MSEGTPAQVRFSAEVGEAGPIVLLRPPEEASLALPSRGQVAVRGSVADVEVETVVEPDGRRGHWLRVPAELQSAAGLVPGGLLGGQAGEALSHSPR